MKTILNPFLSVFTCFVSVFAQKDYGVHDPSTIVKKMTATTPLYQ